MDVLAATRLSDSGELTGTVKMLAKVCRCEVCEMEAAIEELASTGTGQIAKQNGSITIVCRRIKKAHDTSVKRAEAGRVGGSKSQANRKQTPKQLSASASRVSLDGDKKGESREGREEAFERCWKAYPKKTGKDRARRSFMKEKPEADQVIAAIDNYIAYVDQERKSGFKERSLKDGGTWFHQKCWEDEYEINESTGRDVKKKLASESKHLTAAKEVFLAAETDLDKMNAICGAHHTVIHAVEDWAEKEHGFTR